MKRVAFLWLSLGASVALVGCGSEMDLLEDDGSVYYEVEGVGPSADPLITDCVKNFPTSDRSRWQVVNGENVYVDAYGRPNKAYMNLPPIYTAARDEYCQTLIGQWGDAANPSNDYDGGHMIGTQLGGYGRRANIVPQDLNFNRGVWATLENKMADCSGLPTGRLQYYMRLSNTYQPRTPDGGGWLPDGGKLTPDAEGAPRAVRARRAARLPRSSPAGRRGRRQPAAVLVS